MQHVPAQLPNDFVLQARLVHGICQFHRQWIPGDERGFRSRGHRIHSSGDYRSPPPPEEHAGLRTWVRQAMNGDPVTLTAAQCVAVGKAFVTKLQRMDCRVLILACGATHLHVLFEPTEDDAIRQLGKAKQFASLKCPGHQEQLWAESSDAIPVHAREQAYNTFGYIDDHRNEGAWIWRFDQST